MCSSLEGKRESDLRSLQDDELSYSYSCIRSYSKNRFQIQNQLLGGCMPKFKRKPSKLFHESGERNNPIFSQFYYNIEKDSNVNEVNISHKQNSGDGIKTVPSSVFLKWIKYHLKCVKPFWFSNNICTKTNISSFFSKRKEQTNIQNKIKLEVLLNNIDMRTKHILYNYLQNLNLKVEEKHSEKNESICEVNVSSIVNNNKAFLDLLNFFKELDNVHQKTDSTDEKHNLSGSELHIENKFNNKRNNVKAYHTDDNLNITVSENKSKNFQECKKSDDLGNVYNSSCEEKTYIKLPVLCSNFKGNKSFLDGKAQAFSDCESLSRKSSHSNNNPDVNEIPNNIQKCLNEHSCNSELSAFEKTVFNTGKHKSVIDNRCKILKKTFSNDKNDVSLLKNQDSSLLWSYISNKLEYFSPKCTKSEEFLFKKPRFEYNSFFELKEQLCKSNCKDCVNKDWENKNVNITHIEHNKKHKFYKGLKYKINDLENIKLPTGDYSNNVSQNGAKKNYINKMMCNKYKLRVLPVVSKRKFLPYNKSSHSRTTSQNVRNNKVHTTETVSSKKHRRVRFADEVTVQYNNKYGTYIDNYGVLSTCKHHTKNGCLCYSRSLCIDDIKHECRTVNCSMKHQKMLPLQTQNNNRHNEYTKFDNDQSLINSPSSFQSKFVKEGTLTTNCKDVLECVREKSLTSESENKEVVLNKLDDITHSNKDVHCCQSEVLSLRRKYANTSIDFKYNTLTCDGSTQTPSPTVCNRKYSKFTVHKHFSNTNRSSGCNKNHKHVRVVNKLYKLYSNSDIDLILLYGADRLSESKCNFKSNAVEAFEDNQNKYSCDNKIQIEKNINIDETFLHMSDIERKNKLSSIQAVEPEEITLKHQSFILLTEKISNMYDKLQSNVSSLQSCRSASCKMLHKTNGHKDSEIGSLTKTLLNRIMLNNTSLPSGTKISESQNYLNSKHQVDKICQTNSNSLTYLNKKPIASDIISWESSAETVNECICNKNHFKLLGTGSMTHNINKADSTENAVLKMFLKNGNGKYGGTERSISIEDCIKQIFSNIRKENNNNISAEMLELIKLKVIDNLSDEILTQCRELISVKDILNYCLQELDDTYDMRSIN